MRILFATSEVYPLAKSGGLADVSRALPIALRDQGVDARLILPGYNSAIAQLDSPKIETRLPAAWGVEDANLISGLLPGTNVPVWLIHAPSLYCRRGGLYQDESKRDWPDNSRRFSYLARVATALAMGQLSPWRADIVHANDWHAGLVPFYVSQSEKPRPATVFTIHNIAFQGNFARDELAQAEIPDRFFTPDSVEFYGQLSFLKAALRYSDRITTVSPQYSREILTEAYGCGLDGILRSRKADLSGILNGIEDDVWDPAADPLLPQPYSSQDVSGKRVCKGQLQSALELTVLADQPLVGFSSRLTHQKMADILVESVPDILASGAQLVVIGDGDPQLETALATLQSRYPGQMAYRPYDEALAHLLQAGADILLAPARYEPCGLIQLYALRYGTIPVVRRTGGLADTVTDAQPAAMLDDTATGFVFDEPTKEALLAALSRAMTHFREPLAWRRLQLAGMKRDFGWKASAIMYVDLYEGLSGLLRPTRSVYDGKKGWGSLQREIRSAQGGLT